MLLPSIDRRKALVTKLLSVTAAAVVSIVLQPAVSIAQTASPPALATATKSKKSIEIRTTYLYEQSDYVGKPSLDKQTDLSSADTPEGVLYRQMDAMKKGDIDGFMATWDTESKTEISQFNKEKNITDEKLKSVWRTMLEGQEAVLLRRVDYLNFVIIEYGLKKQGAEVTQSYAQVFRRAQSKWFATRDAKDDPVIVNWRTTDKKNLVDVKGKWNQ
jgi:hypothetical protein